MALFYVQDEDRDRPLYVVAADYKDALRKWQNRISYEYPGEDLCEPDRIQRLANDDEVII